jgi:hypothetical protein
MSLYELVQVKKSLMQVCWCRPPSELVNGAKKYEVELILGQRTYGQWKKKQYLIKWKGYLDAHNSWEVEGDMNALELVNKYQTRNPTHAWTLANKRHNKPDTRNMPTWLSHCLSSAKYFCGFYPSNVLETDSSFVLTWRSLTWFSLSPASCHCAWPVNDDRGILDRAGT